MFLVVAVFNVFSLLYQLYMVRHLTTIEYGILNSLFSFLMIISIPSGTLQTVVTKFVSTYYANDNHENIKYFLNSFIKKIFFFSLATFLIFFFCSKRISFFLQIDSPFLVVLLGVITVFSIILPLTMGGLQGLQRFGWLGLTMIANGGLKLVLGILFVSIGFGVTGAMSSLAVSTFASLLISFLILLSILSKHSSLPLQENSNSEINFSEIYKYSYTVTIVILCFMILTNIDVLLVKHFFNPLEAGYYSIAQMAGKVILFLPIAITMVMFPKSSELYSQSKATLHLLKKSLLYVGLMCGMSALFCFLFPELIIKFLSGEENPECIPLVRIFSVTMVFFALVYTLQFYHLSIHSSSIIYFLVLLTIIQVVLICMFHNTLSQVLYIMFGISVLLFLINLYFAFYREKLNAVTCIDSNS